MPAELVIQRKFSSKIDSGEWPSFLNGGRLLKDKMSQHFRDEGTMAILCSCKGQENRHDRL